MLTLFLSKKIKLIINMGKVPPKKPIEKKPFDPDAFRESEGLDRDIRNKEIEWIPLSEAFQEALGVPGIPKGYFTSFRGYSDTGKSTAIYEAVAGCQKIGTYPVIFETEGNWNWDHAKNCGVVYEEYVDTTTGEIKQKGNFLFMTGDDLLKRYETYDYGSSKNGTKKLRHEVVVEDVARFMNYILDRQDEGVITRDICFLWDSVGSANCFKGSTSNSSNNQWTAGALTNCFKSLVYGRIPNTKRIDMPYTNTFAIVQQIWLDNENKVVKHRGGETFYSAPRLIFHFGGILSHSTSKLKAISGGQEYEFATETKVRCQKNHVNGIMKKGSIASTPHGYWNPKKIEVYKKTYKDYILKALNSHGGMIADVDDFEIKKFEIGPQEDDDDFGDFLKEGSED